MKKIKINKGFITQKAGKKLTIFDPETSVLYSFNATAAFIFKNLQKGIGEEQIVEEMTRKFIVTKKTAKKDLEEFLKELRKNKIAAERK